MKAGLKERTPSSACWWMGEPSPGADSPWQAASFRAAEQAPLGCVGCVLLRSSCSALLLRSEGSHRQRVDRKDRVWVFRMLSG